jgi:hypothetical protein
MIWTRPVWEQVKMDAEIGSYQEDSEPARETDRDGVSARPFSAYATPAALSERCEEASSGRFLSALLCGRFAGRLVPERQRNGAGTTVTGRHETL